MKSYSLCTVKYSLKFVFFCLFMRTNRKWDAHIDKTQNDFADFEGVKFHLQSGVFLVLCIVAFQRCFCLCDGGV